MKTIKFMKNPVRYSDSEIQFLKENYEKYGNKYCAEKLNRNLQSVQVKANHLGLFKLFYKAPEGFKKCCSCREILPLERYNFSSRDGVQTFCKSCKKKHSQKYFAKKRATKDGQRHLSIINIVTNAKARSKRKRLDFDIDYNFINSILPTHCSVLGIELRFADGKRNHKTGSNYPSLDRFNNNKGYTKDNVNIISQKANRLKSNASIIELKKVLNYMQNENPILDYQI